MKRKLLYLINPISGDRNKSSLQEMLRLKTQEQGIEFNMLPTNAEGDYSFLPGLIQAENVTDIVICGGDGTVSAVAAALTGSEVRIGIVPMGSGNGLAFAAGIPADPGEALKVIFAAKASLIDGCMINGQFSCMLCGIGFDARVAHEFAAQPRRGLGTYIRLTMKNFLFARPYPFRIRIPSGPGGPRTIEVTAFFVSIANGNQFGNHFTIAPKANLSDGLLDIVVAKRTNRLRFLLSVIRQVMGGYRIEARPDGDGIGKIIYFRSASLVIENPCAAPLHIDGDPRPSAEEFRINVVRDAILLIRP
jgi:diacylglycerol kinase (ATP)